MYRLENFGEKLADENFHQLIRKSFQAMGIPAPDIAPSYRLKDSLAQSIVSTTIKRICCCGSGDSEEKGLLAGGGKRKNLFRLTVRVNKSVTQMEKVISSYHIKRKELAPLKGKMLVSGLVSQNAYIALKPYCSSQLAGMSRMAQ
jgi:hypothetical protein